MRLNTPGTSKVFSRLSGTMFTGESTLTLRYNNLIKLTDVGVQADMASRARSTTNLTLAHFG